MTCLIEFLVEVEDEDSVEQMDYNISHSVVDVDTLPDFEDIHPGEFMELDGDGILIPIEEGVYKMKVAFIASTEDYVLLTQDKLSDEDAAKCYGDMDFIPDADL